MPGPVRAAFQALLDFFYPPVCLVCGTSVESGESALCRSCRDKIVPMSGLSCPRCGMPVEQEEAACAFCVRLEDELDTLRSATWFSGPVPEIMHQFKYRGLSVLAGVIAEVMAGSESARDLLESSDLLVPVPLYRWRKFRRGYNQSEKICRGLAGILGKRFEPGALVRTRNTASQTRLNPGQRKANVEGAFLVARQELVHGTAVCLIDDVITTGATVGACAAALKKAGALRVAACSFTRA